MSHIFRPEVNVAALESVRTRLVQLQESILYFLRSINPDAPSNISWPDLHSKFNVLIAKYLQLTNILADPTNEGRPTPLKNYTVYPHETPLTDQQVQHLSVLLRTKLTPEVEKEDEERLREAYIPGLTQLIGNDERKMLAALRLNIAMHDAVCRKALEFFEEQRQEVLTRVRYESDDEQDTNQAAAAASVADKDWFDGELDFLSGKTNIVFRDEWSFGPPNAGISSEEEEEDEDEEKERESNKSERGRIVSNGGSNSTTSKADVLSIDRDSWLYDSTSSDDDNDDDSNDIGIASAAAHQPTSTQLSQEARGEKYKGVDGGGYDEDEIMEEMPKAAEGDYTASSSHTYGFGPSISTQMDIGDDGGDEDEDDGDEDFDTVMV
ncbi:mediator of RNA polymerase II transcription subunit 8 [Actinomortierella wolfii]|nr:mediator of RNA polymerase II transcription subunit 8 [Actinomortierella wolfii]